MLEQLGEATVGSTDRGHEWATCERPSGAQRRRMLLLSGRQWR
jgi:hypothetical protein